MRLEGYDCSNNNVFYTRMLIIAKPNKISNRLFYTAGSVAKGAFCVDSDAGIIAGKGGVHKLP